MPLDKQRAFVLLFREKTYVAVWNWLRRLGVPRRDRMDLAQDVFLAGYQSFPTYDPLRARPERWLNRITVHVAAHYRDRAHHRREEFNTEEDLGFPDERPSAEEQIDAEETRLLVMERLGELPAEERAILIEHDLEEVPMQAIAARHGIPLSTAYKWRSRALVALRALMEEHLRGGKRRRPLPQTTAGRPPRTPPSQGRDAVAPRSPAPRRPRRAPSPLGVAMNTALIADRGIPLSAPMGL